MMMRNLWPMLAVVSCLLGVFPSSTLRAGDPDVPVENFIASLGGRVYRNPDGGQITEVDFTWKKVTDNDLKVLRDLRYLEVLNLFGTKVTDKGMVELLGFKKLQRLNLGS